MSGIDKARFPLIAHLDELIHERALEVSKVDRNDDKIKCINMMIKLIPYEDGFDEESKLFNAETRELLRPPEDHPLHDFPILFRYLEAQKDLEEEMKKENKNNDKVEALRLEMECTHLDMIREYDLFLGRCGKV